MLEKKDILESVMSAASYRKIRLDTIKPAPYNPRVDLTPDDPEYQKIKASILNHSMMQPIVYNEKTGNAVGGNQRLKILTDMGIEEATCAVINVPLSIEMEVNIALNRLGNMLDQNKLRDAMLQLTESSYDTEKTAFDEAEIEKLTQGFDVTVSSFFENEDDETGDKPEKPKKKRTYRCPHCGEVFEK